MTKFGAGAEVDLVDGHATVLDLGDALVHTLGVDDAKGQVADECDDSESDDGRVHGIYKSIREIGSRAARLSAFSKNSCLEDVNLLV